MLAVTPGGVSPLNVHVLPSVGCTSMCVHPGVWEPLSVSFLMSPQRIAGITAMLQQSLEGLLLEGLQTSDVDIIRHCLRTYATIDKTRDAEALVGQVLVKPYVNEVCAAGVHGRAGYSRCTELVPACM